MWKPTAGSFSACNFVDFSEAHPLHWNLHLLSLGCGDVLIPGHLVLPDRPSLSGPVRQMLDSFLPHPLPPLAFGECVLSCPLSVECHSLRHAPPSPPYAPSAARQLAVNIPSPLGGPPPQAPPIWFEVKREHLPAQSPPVASFFLLGLSNLYSFSSQTWVEASAGRTGFTKP